MSLLCRYLSRRRRLPTSMSSPRREWWSLRCSRRCSVSSLMRAVSSATWTSVEPVSPSSRPNLATMSRFASAVSVIRRTTVAGTGSPTGRLRGRRRIPGRLAYLPRQDDVAMHLLNELVRRLEALLAPHSLDECDAQNIAIEVTFEADQVRLHEQAAAGLERGAHAHVDRRRVAVRPGRIHAVAGADEGVVGDEVRGRHAELAAAPVPHHDLILEQERAAQELRRQLYVTGRDQSANVARGDRLPGHLYERDHACLELLMRTKEVGRALGALAEPEVLPQDTRSAPNRPSRTSATNCSALSEAKSRSNGITTSSSTPSPATRSRLMANGVSSFGVASGWRIARGWGSKVSAVLLPRITSRWPRWTPSNVPMATLRAPAPGSTSGSGITFIPARTLRRAAARQRAAQRPLAARRRR